MELVMSPMGRLKSRGVLVAISMSHRGVTSTLRRDERRLAKQLNRFARVSWWQSANRSGEGLGFSFALEFLLSTALHRHPEWSPRYCLDGFGALHVRWLNQYTASFLGTLSRFTSDCSGNVSMPVSGWLRIGPNGKHLRGYAFTLKHAGKTISFERAAELAHAAERAQRDRSVYP